MSTVSVLIPIYYKENTEVILKCFNSIALQTKIPDEVVCALDDPSTNEIEKALDKVKEETKLNIVRVYCKRGRGLGAVLEVGVKKCTCDYIARMDVDDIAIETRLEKQIDFLDKNTTIDVVGSNIAEFSDSIENITYFRNVPENDADCKKMLRLRDPINHMTAMYRRESILEAGNYNTDMKSCEDTELWTSFYAHNLKFANIQEILVYVHAGSDMYKRRGGKKSFTYIRKAINYKRKVGLINVFNSCFQIVANYFILIVFSNRLRGFVYETFLRKKK